MTTDLTPFDFHGAEVRVLDVNGEPWFVAGDVCAALELGNIGQALTGLDDDERGSISISDGTPGNPNRAVVSESGLYSLILRSRKPEAGAFKRWLTHEVLPAIRRHGIYATPATVERMLADPDTMIAVLTDLKSERAKHAELAAKVEADRPLVAQAATFRQAEGLHTIGDVANALKVWAAANAPGVKVLHEDVWDIAGKVGLVIRGRTVRKNQPTSQAIEAGWAKPKDVVYETDTHGTQARTYTRLTPAGYGRLWDACIAHYLKKAAA